MTNIIRFGLENEVPTNSPLDTRSFVASGLNGRHVAVFWDLVAKAAAFVLLATASTALLMLPYLDVAKHVVADRPLSEQFASLP
jgi:hypothetical protein